MDTSAGARLAVLGLLFAIFWVIVYGNVRNLARLLLKMPVSRRALITWAALGLFVVLCWFDAFHIEPDWVRVTHNTLQTTKLPAGTRLRIVQLSDLHLEGTLQRERRTLDLTAAQQPDIIVLTGDYVNSVNDNAKSQAALENFARQLSQIAPTYAIEGNWDSTKQLEWLENAGVKRISGWTAVEGKHGAKIVLGWLPEMEKIDYKGTADADYRILLCHRPQSFQMLPRDQAANADLVLAGHTHGGQVRIPIFGALLPERNLVGKYQMGMYECSGTHLYVNSGIGMEGGRVPRVRFCCRPEVAVIDILGK